MSFIDWIRELTGKSEKIRETEKEAETKSLVISTPEYKYRIGSDVETEDIWDKRERTSLSDSVPPAVTIDITEYDSKDIVSSLQYACMKYGDMICENPDRLKNIMADLAPTLRSECKLLVLLSKSGNMKKALQSSSWEEADLLLWLENTVSYLVREEFIDELTARRFSRKILEALSGKTILDKKAIEEERRRKQAEEEERKRKQEEADRIHREKLKAQQDKEEQERRTKEAQKVLDELRRKLAAEEKARKDAEEKAKAHEKEKKDVEARLEEERKRRESEKILEIRARLAAEEKARKAESEREKARKEAEERLKKAEAERNAAEEMAKAERQKRELNELLNSISAQNSVSTGSDPTTAKGLYEKYHKSGEKVIIVADSWHGDFCFVVDQIIREGDQYKAKGSCFRKGSFYKHYTYPATGSSYKFSLYKGPSKEKINAAYGIKTKTIQAVNVPSNVASFALNNVCVMTGRKPWGIDINGTVLRAAHWTKLVEAAAEHIMEKYGTKASIKKLGDSSYGNGYAYYFHNGRFASEKYVYFSDKDISIMQGGSKDSVDVIVDMCKHFNIGLGNVKIYYR